MTYQNYFSLHFDLSCAEYHTAIWALAGRHIRVYFTAETAEGAEMNGVNELTNEIIGAPIEVHRTLHNGHPAPRP